MKMVEEIKLPCGHTAVENGEFEIVCPTCQKIFQQVGNELRAKWELPVTKTPKVRVY